MGKLYTRWIILCLICITFVIYNFIQYSGNSFIREKKDISRLDILQKDNLFQLCAEITGYSGSRLAAYSYESQSRFDSTTTDLSDNQYSPTRVDKYGNPVPMTPQEALNLYKDKLSNYEHTEILNYTQVWYLGLDAPKIGIEGVTGTYFNDGYSKEQGEFILIVGDHIGYRYEILEILGHGGNGHVCKAHDHKTGQVVAIKVGKRVQWHREFIKWHEVDLLNKMGKMDKDKNHGFLHLLDGFLFRRHLFIAMELGGINMLQYVTQNKIKEMSLDKLRQFARSMLHTLHFLQQHRIIHRDLTTPNVILHDESKGTVKITDFGFSCYEPECKLMVIGTPNYIAPEVFLDMPYTMSVDMWSFACILATLRTGGNLFFNGYHYVKSDYIIPHASEVSIITSIVEVLDLPPKSLIDSPSAKRRNVFFDAKGHLLKVKDPAGKRQIGPPGTRDLGTALNTNDTGFLDFMKKCFQWKAVQRLTPLEALQHEWITG